MASDGETLSEDGAENRLARLADQLLMLGLRIGNAGAKFALALYMTRFLGLADLGIYGLLVGAATTVPAVLGFGFNDWLARMVVGLERIQAASLAVTRLLLTLAVHIVVQTVGWLINDLLGAPIPWALALPIGLILLLEHLAADAYSILIGRDRAKLANILLFLRAGLWPLVVIGWGLIDPRARTLEVVLYGWVAGLVMMWLVVAAMFAPLLAQVRLRRRLLREGPRGGLPFYLAEIGAVGNLYLDRFLISLFLGLELTGVYTFFWSIANVVHTLSVYGVIQPQMPRLVGAADTRDRAVFAGFRKRMLIESWSWAAALALAAAIAIPPLLPYLGRPLLGEHLVVFGLVMLAALLRIGADSYGFVLYSLRREYWIAITSLAAVALAAALNLMLVPLFGLNGASVAYIAVSAALLASRIIVSRDAEERLSSS